METALSPNQQRAYDSLQQALSLANIVHLGGGIGHGRTTLLRHAHRQLGGAFLTGKEILDALQSRHPLAVEETLETVLLGALRQHDLVFLDDLDLVSGVLQNSCGGAYPRTHLIALPAATLAAYLVETGKRLVVGAQHSLPGALDQWSEDVYVPCLQPEDYHHHCRAHLGEEAAARLDYAKIHRFASHLDGHELRRFCRALRSEPELTTEGFIEYLESQGLSSNVNLREVQQVDLRDLKGCNDVVRSLETNIVLPLLRDDLATELGLRPKRGVLLAGPPGTGKTTVGRALAHRLRGKFFLIDGTVISGTGSFYYQIHQIFEEAKENAPAVIFIDDSDVIFESGQELGLYRYLLTMLDGLESESSGRVCVMLTAMDVANIPPALLRSGRIELWLEMRLPDAGARAEILAARLGRLPAELGTPDLPAVASATEGFTGADLKRLADDAKNLYAYDRIQEQPLLTLTGYLLQAAEAIGDNKRKYAEAEARGRKQRAASPVPGFATYPGMHAPGAAPDW